MAVQPANKKIRQMKGQTHEDVLNAGALTFNRQSSGQKNMPVGPHLRPHKNSSGSFTTNFTAVQALKLGTLLAVYNNSGTVQALTLSDDGAVAALAAGATNPGGDVGIACKPNDWTYISAYDKRFARADSANLFVYIVADDTYITNENPNI
jgi:hypothetical protein